MTSGPLATRADATSTPSLSGFDSRLLYDINHARAARGLRKLTVVAGTTDIAHHWSCHTASTMTLAHNLNLSSQLVTHGSALWTTYGENVGGLSSTYGADRLFRLYMNDAPHRANILGKAFRYVGLWT
ncbi:MAG TPA: CAP domain-containing protein, partial [Ilumatobacteraceae bacterium]